jgi:hypothetical protein
MDNNSNEKKEQFKGSNNFKNAIKKHLDDYAKKDKLFAKSYKKESKSLDECMHFIIKQVMKSGANGYPDEEIYQLARHYFDEDDIKIDKPITNVQVIVNQQLALSDEEVQRAKQKAIDQIIWDEKAKFTKNTKVNNDSKSVKQETLF